MLSIQQKFIFYSIALAMFFLSATAAKKEINIYLGENIDENHYWKTIESNDGLAKIATEAVTEINNLLKNRTSTTAVNLIKKLDPTNRVIWENISKLDITTSYINNDDNALEIKLNGDSNGFFVYSHNLQYITIKTDFNKTNGLKFILTDIATIKQRIQKKFGYNTLLQKLYKEEAHTNEYANTETPNANAMLYLKVIPDKFLHFNVIAKDKTQRTLFAQKTDLLNRLKYMISKQGQIETNKIAYEIDGNITNEYKSIKFNIENKTPTANHSSIDDDYTKSFIEFGEKEKIDAITKDEQKIINVKITAPDNLTFPQIKADANSLSNITWKDLFGAIHDIIHGTSVYSDQAIKNYLNTNFVTPIFDHFKANMVNLSDERKNLFVESVLFNTITAMVLSEAIESKATAKPNDFSGEYIPATFKLEDTQGLVAQLKNLRDKPGFFYDTETVENKDIKSETLFEIIKYVINLIFEATKKAENDPQYLDRIAKYYGFKNANVIDDLALAATSYFYEFYLPSQNKKSLEFDDVLKNIPHLLRGLYLKKNQFPWIKYVEKKVTTQKATPLQQNLYQLRDNLAELNGKLALLNEKLRALQGKMLAHH